MSLNAAVQHLGAGFAAAAGGLLLQAFGGNAVPSIGEGAAINLNEGEPLPCFPLLGLLACAAMTASVFLAGRIRLAAAGAVAPDSAAVAGSHS
jgi:hypothetical protein